MEHDALWLAGMSIARRMRLNKVNKNSMLKILIATTLGISLAASALAQNNIPRDTRSGVRIDQKKPAIYLEFVRIGTCSHAPSFTVLSENPCQSKRTDINLEVFDAVWLRIRNNSRWSIELKAGNLYAQTDGFSLQDKRMVSVLPEGFEIDAEYDVEAERGYDRIETDTGTKYVFIDVKAPYVDPFAVSSPIFLPPGRSLIFAVKREHLAKHLRVFPTYKYEWETSEKDSGFEEPRHRVYFSDYHLGKALEKLNPQPQLAGAARRSNRRRRAH
jgi:hypothetical protein